MKAILLVTPVLILVLLYPTLGRADVTCVPLDGEILSVEQQGQDVSLVVSARFGMLKEHGPCAWPQWMLWRVSDVETRAVYLPFVPDIEDSIGPSGSCHTPTGHEECEADPEDCDDCDGDGINECPHGECLDYLFELLDACVPASEVTYHLSTYGPYLNDDYDECWDYICADQESFEIEDSGEACTPLGPDDPAGTDPCAYLEGEIPCGDDDDSSDDDDSANGEDDDTEDDETPDDDTDDDTDEPRCGSCSASPGTDAVGVSLALLMALLILGARRRSS